MPCGYNNQVKQQRLQLIIYPTFQDIQPRTNISLWEAKIEEPNFDLSDPQLIIIDQPSRTCYRFASATTGDKQQLRWLYDACRGMSQFTTLPTQHAPKNGIENVGPTHSVASSSCWLDDIVKEDYNGWGLSNSGSTSYQGGKQNPGNPPNVVQATDIMNASVPSIPSAPPIPYDDDGPMHYPSIDSSPVDWSTPTIEHEAQAFVTTDLKDEGKSSSCIICWEAPVEGACIPCGHMAGCMKCLDEIKAKKGLCPVCRAHLNQVIRVYAV